VGPIHPGNWREVPVTRGRVATEEDVRAGCAVFYLENADSIGALPISLPLPSLAKFLDVNIEVPVVIIQAEEAEGRTYIGFRFLEGGNGLASREEIKLSENIEA